MKAIISIPNFHQVLNYCEVSSINSFLPYKDFQMFKVWPEVNVNFLAEFRRFISLLANTFSLGLTLRRFRRPLSLLVRSH